MRRRTTPSSNPEKGHLRVVGVGARRVLQPAPQIPACPPPPIPHRAEQPAPVRNLRPHKVVAGGRVVIQPGRVQRLSQPVVPAPAQVGNDHMLMHLRVAVPTSVHLKLHCLISLHDNRTIPTHSRRVPEHPRYRQGIQPPSGSTYWSTVQWRASVRMSRWAASGVVYSRNSSSTSKFWACRSRFIPTAVVLSRGPQAIGRSRGGLNTKIHMVAASACSAVLFALSPGQDHDAPHGRELLKKWAHEKRSRKGSS